MLNTYQYPKFDVVKAPELDGATQRYPVVVVGAGPVGLAAAIDLAQSGVPVLLLDDDDTVSVGSRGVCYAKRTLEVLDRLGLGEPCMAKGVSWNVGRTFFREQEVYNFNLLPQPDHKRPGMINLQQYYLEEFAVKRAQQLPNLDLRFKNKVTSVAPQGDGASLQVETPDGAYALQADWLVVADGARSNIRRMMNLDIEGKIFKDRFLIADVVMKADFPHERWFWFDPPFHPGQSVLLHRQADNVYRIDFQLGWDADPQEEKKPEKVIPRIKAMLGDARKFELEWVSVYTFQCRRMNAFTHGHVLFVGDAAHQVSPFGARGANSGIQDTDNLCWKLKLVIERKAPPALLDTYSEERVLAAEENLLNSTRSTDFITPKSKTSLMFRNAVLNMAREHAFARALVNSGRLSVPSFLTESRLNTPDDGSFAGDMVPGAPMDDAPLRKAGQDVWLLDQVGQRFGLLLYLRDPASLHADTLKQLQAWAIAAGVDAQTDKKNGAEASAQAEVQAGAGAIARARPAANFAMALDVLLISPAQTTVPGIALLHDYAGRFAERFDAQDGTVYLIRPDQHVAARWRAFDAAQVQNALARATCNLH